MWLSQLSAILPFLPKKFRQKEVEWISVVHFCPIIHTTYWLSIRLCTMKAFLYPVRDKSRMPTNIIWSSVERVEELCYISQEDGKIRVQSLGGREGKGTAEWLGQAMSAQAFYLHSARPWPVLSTQTFSKRLTSRYTDPNELFGGPVTLKLRPTYVVLSSCRSTQE